MGNKILFIILLVLLLLPLQARADIGPKPFAHFIFDYKISLTADVANVQLIQCRDNACAGDNPLRDIGPQSVECDNNSCNVIAYSFSEYMKIKIQFADGVELESNVFQTSDELNARYTVGIYSDRLEVTDGEGIKELSETGQWILLGVFYGLVTIIIELIAGAIFLLLFRIRGRRLLKMMGIIVAANLISLCILYVIGWFSNGALTWLIIAEVVVVVVETVLLYYLSGKTLTIWLSLSLAVVMNIISVAVDVILFQQLADLLRDIYFRFF